MAYLMVKRLWDGELVPILSARCSQGTAMAALGIVYCQPGKRVGESQPGDIYIEIEHDRTGDLLTDPVIFPKEQARLVLLKLEVSADQVDVVLSDAYADTRLDALRAFVAEHMSTKRRSDG